MPRPPRIFNDNVPQHIVNRGNQRAQIFKSAQDYLGFVGAMADAGERTVVRVVAFCLMPNHWHLVLWPHMGSEISTYMQLLMNSHLRDVVPRHGTSGLGHIYQGRFKNFPIYNERHFLNVCRYVEANARTASLVMRAEDWPWCSLSCQGPAPDINLLSTWPIPRPRTWLEEVNRSLSDVAVHPAPGWVPPDVPATLGASHLAGRGGNFCFLDIV
jgi:putative transposase